MQGADFSQLLRIVRRPADDLPVNTGKVAPHLKTTWISNWKHDFFYFQREKNSFKVSRKKCKGSFGEATSFQVSDECKRVAGLRQCVDNFHSAWCKASWLHAGALWPLRDSEVEGLTSNHSWCLSFHVKINSLLGFFSVSVRRRCLRVFVIYRTHVTTLFQ